MPKEAATAFIMGFVRRDFGAAGLSHMPLSDIQKLVGLITLTIFVPCIASCMVLFKERGRQEAMILVPSILTIAFIIGGLVAQLFGVLNSLVLPYTFFILLIIVGLLLGRSRVEEG